MLLVLDNGTIYQARPVDQDEADRVGCPESDTYVEGSVFKCYGLTLPRGRGPVPVRVNGYRNLRGQRVRFVTPDVPGTADFLGFLVRP